MGVGRGLVLTWGGVKTKQFHIREMPHIVCAHF